MSILSILEYASACAEAGLYAVSRKRWSDFTTIAANLGDAALVNRLCFGDDYPHADKRSPPTWALELESGLLTITIRGEDSSMRQWIYEITDNQAVILDEVIKPTIEEALYLYAEKEYAAR